MRFFLVARIFSASLFLPELNCSCPTAFQGKLQISAPPTNAPCRLHFSGELKTSLPMNH